MSHVRIAPGCSRCAAYGHLSTGHHRALECQVPDIHISHLTDKETVSEQSRGTLQRTRRFCTLALWPSARHLSFFICRQGNLMSTLLGLDEASWLGPGEQDMA